MGRTPLGLRRIGIIRSRLKTRAAAPKQGREGAPDAWLEVRPSFAAALEGPLGLHPVTVKRIAGNRLRIGPIEAIDGTPVIDIKPSLGRRRLA